MLQKFTCYQKNYAHNGEGFSSTDLHFRESTVKKNFPNESLLASDQNKSGNEEVGMNESRDEEMGMKKDDS